jgi:hypothetical protein
MIKAARVMPAEISLGKLAGVIPCNPLNMVGH